MCGCEKTLIGDCVNSQKIESMWPEWLLDLKQIMNHTQVSVMISDQDKDFLNYRIDLKKVLVRSHPRSSCKVIFSLGDKSYFWNMVIIKEYYLDITASDPGWGHGQSQEECERRSEEHGSVLGPRAFLAVSMGAQGDGAPWPVLMMLRMAGTLQPPVVTPGEDATLFRVEAGEDGEAQVDGVVAGIRRVFQLLAEDIIEDAEVVPDE
ncbi:hypothetical protein MG293_020850 [Ovis ammon polii]|uniref:Uncharacterized protein n=1 Tax=Ovis ammon polii TaxID=230172 RepID=A0AAD4TLP2_OVIAM|nr:hypothetical protein MG293_020850 [Ovis ammon polii]